jgi:hypothetical protein
MCEYYNPELFATRLAEILAHPLFGAPWPAPPQDRGDQERANAELTEWCLVNLAFHNGGPKTGVAQFSDYRGITSVRSLDEATAGLPLRSSREQDEFRAWHKQRADAREAAANEMRREAEAKRERAAALDIGSVIALIDQKFDECGALVLESATATTQAAEVFSAEICSLRTKTIELETSLTRAHTELANTRAEMSGLRSEIDQLRRATQVELKGSLVDFKAEMLSRLDSLSALLNSTAARRTEEGIDRRLGDLAGKLVN